MSDHDSIMRDMDKDLVIARLKAKIKEMEGREERTCSSCLYSDQDYCNSRLSLPCRWNPEELLFCSWWRKNDCGD